MKTDINNKLAFIRNVNAKRDRNSERYGLLNIILMLLFPFFITTMAEINQFKYVGKYLSFATARPGVITFDVVVASLVFLFMLAVFRKGWLAVTVQSFVYMALSITELFKYGTNGNHLILSDMKLIRSVKSLSSFAYIKITPRLIVYCAIVILFALIVFWFNPKFEIQPAKRVIMGLMCVAPASAMILVPSFYTPVYNLFGVDTTESTNDFLLNEKFSSNSFLAFIVQTASENYANRLVEPSNYNEDYVSEITSSATDAADKKEDFHNGVKPNVIFIMSESFADFRVFDELNVSDDYYKGFDKAASEGHSGTIITPTYASWTVRSEFELMFGLPVRGLNTPNMPQRVLADREQPALAQYYKSWGYSTAYVHPFTSTFYSRQRIYAEFGFDRMIFHNSTKDDPVTETDFTVPVEYFGTYVDDNTVYAQLLDLVKTTDDPLYVHTTTMQNHQPYDQGEDPSDEFGNYLTWIKHSSDGLTDFLDKLKNIDEPTVVFFVGDHFPSLRGETSVYNQLGINGENCSILYEQKYFVWSNYGADLSVIPDEPVSFFYMPYIIMNIIDAPHDAFIETMLDNMKNVPVYSTDYNNGTPDNEELNVLTYDRVIGDVMSPCPIPEDVLEASKNN